MASLSTSILTLALLGGYAIACERADRSSEFLAYQPIFRGKILASKLVWPIIAAAVIWTGNLLVLFACGKLPDMTAAAKFAPSVGLLLVIGFLCFSVGWLVSSLQDSPTFAVGGGVMAPVVIGLCFGAANWLAHGKLSAVFPDEFGISYCVLRREHCGGGSKFDRRLLVLFAAGGAVSGGTTVRQASDLRRVIDRRSGI